MLVLYNEFEPKDQKCPVSQITDLYFARRHANESHVLIAPNSLYKNQHYIELYIRKVLKNGKTEISCLSLQSWRSSSRKIQIFKSAYSALPLVYSLFRFNKNHHCIECYIWKVLKNRKREVIYSHSLQRTSFAKYRFSNMHILNFPCFIPCFIGSHGGIWLL